MKSMDLGCGVGSGRNSEDVFYVSASLSIGTKFCEVDVFQNGILKKRVKKKTTPLVLKFKTQPAVGVNSFAYM